jgi:hypothetical protein
LKLFGGRKFVGVVIVSLFMLLFYIVTTFFLPQSERAWDFLDAAWPGFLFLLGFYMGVSEASKILSTLADKKTGGDGQGRQGGTPCPTEVTAG